MKLRIFWVFLLIFLAGCTSVTNPTPDLVVPDKASYDGNERNSGLLYQISTGGFIITQNAKDRYVALAIKYGEHCTPVVNPDDGITPVYIITNETMDNFAKFTLWQKNPEVLNNMPLASKKKWWQFWKK